MHANPTTHNRMTARPDRRAHAALTAALTVLAGAAVATGIALAATSTVPGVPQPAPTATTVRRDTPMDRYRAAIAQHYGTGIDVDKATAAGVHLCDELRDLGDLDRQEVIEQVRTQAPPQAGYAIDAAAGTLCPVP